MPTEEQKAEVKARAMKIVYFVRDCFLKLGDAAISVWNNIRSGKYKKHTQGIGTTLFGASGTKAKGQDPFGFGEGNGRQGDTIQDLFGMQSEAKPIEHIFGIEQKKTTKKDDDDYFKRIFE